jgi:hypothetical protein
MIQIHKSTVADTRSCDPSEVTKEQLLAASKQHIDDVTSALMWFREALKDAAAIHDYDKITEIDHFHKDFVGGFKNTTWWDNHRKIHRHHLNAPDGIPEDVNLIDVIEYICDCVMAGMARTGTVYDISSTPDLLERAFRNTVSMLKSNVEVVEKH